MKVEGSMGADGSPTQGSPCFAERLAHLESLRPAGVGELLDQAVELLRQRPLACLGTAILCWIPGQLIASLASGEVGARDPSLAAAQGLAGLAITYLVTTTTAIVVALVGQAHWEGRPLPRPSLALRTLASLPLVLATNLLTLALILPGLMACVLPGIYLMWRLIFAPVVVALEDTDPLRALARSWRLTSVGLSRWVAGSLFVALMTLPMNLLVEELDVERAGTWLLDWLPSLSPGVVEALVLLARATLLGGPGALGAALITMLYLDQRLRLEGRDLELRLECLSGLAGEAPRAPRSGTWGRGS